MEQLNLNKYTVVVESLVQQDDGNFYWVPEQVEIDPGNDLAIDDTNVDGELARMGHLLAYYGDISARLKAQFVRKEEEIEGLEAYIDKEIREKVEEDRIKDPKIKPPTETHIKKLIVGHEKYAPAIGILQASRVYSYQVDNLVKALVKKADALNALAYNQRAERKNF